MKFLSMKVTRFGACSGCLKKVASIGCVSARAVSGSTGDSVTRRSVRIRVSSEISGKLMNFGGSAANT